MTMGLTDEEAARLYALAASKGYVPPEAQAQAQAPLARPAAMVWAEGQAPPMPAPPAPSPLDASLSALANPRPAGPARPVGAGLDLSQMPPSTLANAHTKPPGWSDPSHAISPENTTSYMGNGGANAAAAPPPPAIPATLTTTSGGASQTTQRGIKLSEDTKRARDEMGSAGRREGELRAEAVEAVSKARQEGERATIDTMQANEDARLRQAHAADVALAERRQSLETMMSDVENEKVDPNHWWSSKSTGDKIATAIGMMLGGFSAGYSGRPNEAAQYARDAIAADIDAQKANIEAKRSGVRAKAQLYDLAKSAFHDEADRDAAARAGALALVQKQADLALDKASDPLDRAKIEAFKREIAKDQVQVGAHLDEMTADKTSTATHSSSSTAPNPMAATGGVDPQLVVTSPSGKTFMANTPAEGAKLRAQSALTSNVQANIDKALSMRRQISLTSPLEARALMKQLRSLQAETAQLVTVARGQGAMSKGDQDVADQAIGNMVPDIFDQVGMGAGEKVLENTRQRFGEQFERDAATQTGGRQWAPPRGTGGRR